jgi:hypothetical protein
MEDVKVLLQRLKAEREQTEQQNDPAHKGYEKVRILINPPPSDDRCQVCGRHISELKPFGGSGNPLVGDFNSELLVKIWRPSGPYNDEAMKAIDEALASGDPLQWFKDKYGAEKGESLYWAAQAYDCIGASWECRDCIVLNHDEYFGKPRQRYQEHGNE